MLNDELRCKTKMYKSLTIYLYQNSYYEDLVVELFDIENRKKEVLKKINTAQEFKYLDKSKQDLLYCLIEREKMILKDLIKANSGIKEEFGLLQDNISKFEVKD